MSNNTPQRRTGIRHIAINGRFLDEVQTRLEDDHSGSVSHTSYPAEQHYAIEDEDGVTLQMPAVTALQLYHDGIVPANHEQSVELTVADRSLGAFFVQWLRGLSGRGFGDPMLLRPARKLCPAQKPVDPRAWLHTLVPLQLHHRGVWDPDQEYWGEEGEPIEEWATPIIARGPRPMYEMEQVLPGADPDDPDSDPILRANNLRTLAGRRGRGRYWNVCSSRICVVSMRMRTSVTCYFLTMCDRRYGTTNGVCSSVAFRLLRISTVCCHGA